MCTTFEHTRIMYVASTADKGVLIPEQKQSAATADLPGDGAHPWPCPGQIVPAITKVKQSGIQAAHNSGSHVNAAVCEVLIRRYC